jgi:hypothetical protein
MKIAESIRELIAKAPLAHLTTLNSTGVVSVNWWKSSWHQPSTSEQLPESLLTPPPFVN